MEPIKVNWDETKSIIIIRLNQADYCFIDYVVRDQHDFEYMLKNASEFLVSELKTKEPESR